MAKSSSADDVVTLGRVVGVFGIKGWVKVRSYSRPPDGILGYKQWLIGAEGDWQSVVLLGGRPHGKGIIASLEGYADRDQATALVGADIGIAMAELPSLAAGEYYWAQLQGLRVRDLAGIDLGVVSHLLETGANDVMVVVAEPGKSESTASPDRLIPYTPSVVNRVDLDAGVIVVDWDWNF
jgi:16S rRNA processing protein RimM